MTGPVSIALFRPRTWLDRQVDRLSGGAGFSHAELVLPDGGWLSSTYRDGLRISSSRADEGYAVVMCGDIRWKADSDLFREFVFNEAGKYDTAGVMRFVFRFMRQSRNRWFCSEAVVAAARFAGLDVMGQTPAHLISPNDMAMFYGVR
jgi:hypothetical protein